MRCKKALLEFLPVETDHKLPIATAKRDLASLLLGNNFFSSYKYELQSRARFVKQIDSFEQLRKKCCRIKSRGGLFVLEFY